MTLLLLLECVSGFKIIEKKIKEQISKPTYIK